MLTFRNLGVPEPTKKKLKETLERFLIKKKTKYIKFH